jgi:hypothetical protein
VAGIEDKKEDNSKDELSNGFATLLADIKEEAKE